MQPIEYGKPIIEQNGNILKLQRINAFNESYIQELIFSNPDCLPIAEIDEAFLPAIPVCKELLTPVGSLDIFMITPSGRIIVIETKLWRNPEARRKVIAQIMDYARELTKWSYEDLQREINKKLKIKGNTLYQIACGNDSESSINESSFVDSVSRNLKKGNFLLLIVGDGIREGASNITEFLASSANLNFTFGMIELAIYNNINIGTIILPRINVKTVELKRIILELQDGIKYTEESIDTLQEDNIKVLSGDKLSEKNFYQHFWQELINELEFDDQGQPMPDSANSTNLFIYLPSRHIWISAYFMKSGKRIGVYVRCSNAKIGKEIAQFLDDREDEIKRNLEEGINWSNFVNGKGPYVRKNYENIFSPEKRDEIKDFFKYYLNYFVNVFRPILKDFEQ